MENDNKIVSDLKGLISIVNDGKEGYEEAAKNVNSSELKNIFHELSAQRAEYALELKSHITEHGGKSENEDGGVLGALHRTWMDIKQALTGKEEKAILEAIVTGENAALEKYKEVMKDYEDHSDHYTLLTRQKDGIELALQKIKSLQIQYA